MAEQEADPASVLAHARALIALKKTEPALRLGDISFLDASEPLMAFERSHAGSRLLCVFNMSDGAVPATAALLAGETLVETGQAGETFGPFAARIARL